MHKTGSRTTYGEHFHQRLKIKGKKIVLSMGEPTLTCLSSWDCKEAEYFTLDQVTQSPHPAWPPIPPCSNPCGINTEIHALFYCIIPCIEKESWLMIRTIRSGKNLTSLQSGETHTQEYS